MKMLRKLAIFVGSGLIIIGLIIALIAFVFGGRVNNAFQGERTNLTETYQYVNTLNIDYSAGEISIVNGEEFKIVAENVSKGRFTSKVENGVWTITDKNKSFFYFIGNINWNYDPKVTIYLPKNTMLKECSFSIGAGKISADVINADTFSVKVGAGEIDVSNLTAKDSNLDCGVGRIGIEGSISGNSKINCGVGEIFLNLKGDPDSYNYTVKVGIGETKINGTSFSGISDKKITNNNAASEFNIDCGIGEINLTVTPYLYS